MCVCVCVHAHHALCLCGYMRAKCVHGLHIVCARLPYFHTAKCFTVSQLICIFLEHQSQFLLFLPSVGGGILAKI